MCVFHIYLDLWILSKSSQICLVGFVVFVLNLFNTYLLKPLLLLAESIQQSISAGFALLHLI